MNYHKIINYCKTHKAGLFLLCLTIYIVIIYINTTTESFRIDIKNDGQKTKYEKTTFFLNNRDPGFLSFWFQFKAKAKSELPNNKEIRTIFTKYHGLEIFKVELCNARQQCDTLRAEIDMRKEEEDPIHVNFYDSKGFVPVYEKRLEFKKPAQRGTQKYSVEINPYLMEKIIPFYDLEIFIADGLSSNIVLRYIGVFPAYIAFLLMVFFPFSLVMFPAILVLIVWVFYRLLKPGKGDM